MKHLFFLSSMSEAAEDIRRVLTIVFRGIESLPLHDLERTLSFDMEWVAPHEAETVVAALLETGWLEENANEVKPAVELGEVTVPYGWFPRPTRLLKPIPAMEQNSRENIEPAPTPPPTVRPTLTSPVKVEESLSGDPRANLTRRVARFVARKSGLEEDELERRAQRKQAAFDLITPWLAYALVAREQGLEMDDIVAALAVV